MSATQASPSGLRPLITPEGVALSLTLGDRGQRLVAFLIDLACITLALVALTILAAVLGWGGGGDAAIAIWIIGFFLLRNFWFVAFELTPRAATPGKRLLGLRVAARDGGRLTGDAILARNLVREIELFLPLTVLAIQGTNAGWALIPLGLGWTGIFLLFPFLNRDRLRVGDLLAGTWVVLTPEIRLLADLAAPDAAPTLAFSPAQLAAYGIKELHVLEDVLRRHDPEAIVAVATRIRARIGWTRGPVESDAAFLAAYYAALRRTLERGLLFGKRRRDKFDTTPSS